ncbi:MAG TPA: NUDIX hydrolase [Candidatus Dormibacteraeota bacterium]|nr:NUDIX hydrolase [Candidatus Dormibacteraeota bacterium]
MKSQKRPTTKAQLFESKVVYRGPVFLVRRDRVAEPGGVVATRDLVVHSGSVVVLPVLSNGKILLIRQYRHAAGQFLWELVAGRIDPGEKPLAAARRELVEETGYTAQRFTKMMDVFPTPGFVSERMLVYAARDLKAGAARPEADEKIVNKSFSVRDIEVMMRSGKLRDAKSIAGILFYMRFVRR